MRFVIAVLHRYGREFSAREPRRTAAHGRYRAIAVAALMTAFVSFGLPVMTAAAGGAPQTITFGSLADHTYGDPPFDVSATASSGLTVTFSAVNSSGVCASNGTNGATITIDGSGTCTVQADQAGDSTYAAAPPVQQSFAVAGAPATISITDIPGAATSQAGSNFTATYSYNGNGPTFVTSSTPSICAAGGSVVYLVSSGTCTVMAHADATGQSLAATGAPQSFTVTALTVPACTKTWAAAASGNWSNPSNWSPAGVPSSTDNVCIAADTASYTVTVDTSEAIGSLQLTGTANTETLDIPAGESLSIAGNSFVSANGAITMETATNYSSLELNGHTLTNAGTFTVEAGTYGAYLYGAGSFDNTGTAQVNGTLFTADNPTVTNATSGTIAASVPFSPQTFVQAGGTNTGTPLSPSTLVLSGGGPATFQATTMTVQGGPLQAGQSITVGAGAALTLGSDLTNDGTITMATASNYSNLFLAGYTLTNAGTFTLGAGPYGAYLYGAGTFDNTGTAEIDGTLNASDNPTITNTGSLKIGSTGTVSPSVVSFTNATGGTITNSGTWSGGTFVQAGGSNTGTPLSPSTVVLSGGGSASFQAGIMTVQGGPLRAGQSIAVDSGGELTLGNDLTNNGTITMATATNYSYLTFNSYTLTNAGAFTVGAGNYGAYLDGAGTFDNTGTAQVNGTLYTSGNPTFTNATGGTIAATVPFSPTTFVQAGGTNTGTPLSPSTLVLSGGGSATFQATTMTVQGGPLQAGQSITVTAGAALTLGSDLTNDGTITMATASNYSNLFLNGYTLTNAATFTIGAGPYGAYLYGAGTFDNTGTAQVDGTLYTSASPTFTNTGSLAIGSTGTFVPSGASFTNATGGTIANSGTWSGGTFVQAGGSNTGTPLSPSTLALSGGGSASFQATGMTVQGGPLQASQSITVDAGGALTLGNDLTNNGTITMATATNYSNLFLNGYTLANPATFTIGAGPYGAYLYGAGTFDNTGTAQVDGTLYTSANPTITNNSTLTVGSTGSLSVQSFSQASSGTLVFGHDATGATGTLASSSLSLAGCLGASGPNLPVGTTLNVLSWTSLTGQFACERFPTQIYSVSYLTNQVQLVATNMQSTTPLITSGASATFTAGSANSFTVVATGTPTPALTVSGSLPSGVSFVDNGDGTGTLSGTPAAGSAGTYPLTITAANGAVTPVTQSFTLNVAAPPTITSPPNATFLAGSAGTFTISATGFPTPALTVSGPLPPGVTFVDNGNGTGTMSGTPAAGSGGTYPVTVTASSAGLTTEQTLTLLVATPPSVSTSVAPAATTVGAPVSVTIAASDPQGSPLSYSVQFGDSTSTTGAYPGSPVTVTHTYQATGPWTVLVQVTDAYGASAQATAVAEVDQGQPLTANAGPDLTTTVGNSQGVTLDGSASSPACCIASYHWHVSGGSLSEDYSTAVVPGLTFTTPGTYTATLTVQQGINTSTASTQITVAPQSATGVAVTVLADATSTPVQGADVVVLSAAGQQFQATSGSNGIATLNGLADGSYTAYVVATGYDPNQAALSVSGGTGAAAVRLAAGGLVTAGLTSAPVTDTQTLINAGIDPNDPNNFNIYQFDINLVFEGTPVTFSGFVSQGSGFVGTDTGFSEPGTEGEGSAISCSDFSCTGPTVTPPESGGGSSSGSGGYSVQVTVDYHSGVPQLLELVVPGQAKWLKEFYNVSMSVTNLGSPAFDLTGGDAELQLPVAPDGSSPLSLPALFGQLQPALQALPDIPGGQTATANWLVRGDEEGDWTLSASYSGTLQPVDQPVQLEATLAKPIHVWGLSAIQLSVSADNTAAVRNPYAVTVTMTNVTNADPADAIPLLNVGLALLTQGAINFIYQPDQPMSVSTAELDPGQSLSINAILFPDLSGNLIPYLSSIAEEQAGGLTDSTAVITGQTDQGGRLTASGSGVAGGVQLTWQGVPGATGYQIWSTAAWPDPLPAVPSLTLTQFSGGPVATVGAVTQTTITGLTDGTSAEYAIVPLFDGTPDDAQNMLVHATAGATQAATTLTADPGGTLATPTVVGQPYTVAWQVTPDSGTGTPTGTVTVTGGSGCSAPVQAGECQVTSVDAGDKTLQVSYGGDTNFQASSADVPHEVDPASTTTAITSELPDPTVVGEPYTVDYSVTVAPPGAGAPSGTVVVSDGTDSCSAPVSTGTCALTSTTPGPKSLTATFQSADPNFLGSSTSTTHQVDQAPQSITFTSTAPSNAVYLGQYQASAAGGASGNPVTFAIDPSASAVCSVVGATVSFTGTGTCTIDANQAGSADYLAAPTAQQSFKVAPAPQSITFTSTAPTNAVYLGQYQASAAGGASGLPVTFAIDPAASAVCSVVGATVSFTATGTCTIDANQAGSTDYLAAPTAQQSFTVAAAPQNITFTSSAPTNATVSGPTYTVSATGGGSGLPVTFAIDPAASAVCSLSGATVSFTATGTCTIDANQAGSADYLAAPTAHQSFTVSPAVAGLPAITSPSSATAMVGTAFTFTVTTSGYPLPAISSTTLPAGLTLTQNGGGTATIGGTPTKGGAYTITLTAKNTVGKSTQMFTLTVDQAPAITSAAKATATVGTAFTFKVTTTGYPTPAITTAGLPAGLASKDNGDGTATISGTPTAGDGGVYTAVTIRAQGAGMVNQTFTLTVNEAPSITSPTNAAATVGTPFNFTVTTSGYPLATISASGLPLGLALTKNGDSTATIAGTPTKGGLYPVTITAKNTAASTTQTLALTVDQAPAITSAAKATATVGTAFSVKVTTTGYPAPAITANGLPPGLGIVDNGDGTATIAGMPAPGSGGVYSFMITATGAGAISQTFTLTVDQGPAITSAASGTATAGTAFSFTVTSTGFPLPTIAATGLPPGLTLTKNPDGTATIAGTPTKGGSYPVIVTATNAVSKVTQTLTLTVAQPPAITSAAKATATVGTAFSFTVTTNGYPYPAIKGTGLPAGLTLVDNGNGTATLAGTPGSSGVYNIAITATSNLGAANQVLKLTIT